MENGLGLITGNKSKRYSRGMFGTVFTWDRFYKTSKGAKKLQFKHLPLRAI
jgi:hypothetical protein